jgi:hypothetical protein
MYVFQLVDGDHCRVQFYAIVRLHEQVWVLAEVGKERRRAS